MQNVFDRKWQLFCQVNKLLHHACVQKSGPVVLILIDIESESQYWSCLSIRTTGVWLYDDDIMVLRDMNTIR